MARGTRRTGGNDRRRSSSRRGDGSGGGFDLSNLFGGLFSGGGDGSRRAARERSGGRTLPDAQPARLVSEGPAAASTARGARAGKPPSERWNVRRRRLNVLFIAGGIAFGLLLMIVVPVGLVFAWGNSLGGLEQLREQMDPGPSVSFAWRNGVTIVHDRPALGRKVEIRSLPAFVPLAFIATEDRDFYEHDGVNNVSLARAALVDLRSGHGAQGGSTITQQLVKFAILRDFSRTPMRYLRTMFIARNIERDLRQFYPDKHDMKDQILGFYLASVDFGTGARAGTAIHGLDLAAETYYGVTPQQLRPAQAAVLAGMINGPSLYNPCRHWDNARNRGLLVLHNMLVVPNGLSQADYNAAVADLNANPAPCPQPSNSALYLVDYIRNAHLTPQPPPPGPNDFTRQQITVTTTLDPDAQAVAERVIQERMPPTLHPEMQVALVAMDGSGAVRAMMGGRSYAASPYNRAASRIPRQIGSTFKAFIYLAAFEHGATPDNICNNTVGSFRLSAVPFSPAYEGGGSQLTLRRAFATSSNIVATRLAYSLGYDTVAAQAALLGFRPPPPRVSSFPLVANSRAIDLAAAYAAFSNGGHRVEPRFFEMPGAPNPLAAPPVISARALAYMTDIGLAVVEEPGATAHRNAPVPGLRFAGKTGTTNNQADAWFIAFGENFVVAAWVGYDRPRPGHNNGGDLPAMIVHQFLAEQHLGWGQPSQTWPPANPDGDTLGTENSNTQGVAQVSAADGTNYCQ